MEDSKLPRILIGCPTNSVKDYAFIDWLMHVRQIDYPKDKLCIMMADNSKENSYEKYLQSWGIKTRRIHPRNRNTIEYICDSHNAVRKYFLDGDFEYLLHLESDVMIQTQTLRTLLFHSQQRNLEIVSASYFINEGEYTTPIIHRIEGEVGQNLKFKECLSLSNNFFPVYASGVGCMLIRKDVFTKHDIKFRFNPKQQIHPDSFFNQDLFEKGIQPYLDTSLMLKHYSKDWNHSLDYNLIIPKK